MTHTTVISYLYVWYHPQMILHQWRDISIMTITSWDTLNGRVQVVHFAGLCLFTEIVLNCASTKGLMIWHQSCRHKPGPKSMMISYRWYECLDIMLRNSNNHSWWRHQMETFSALLSLCAVNSPATGEFPSQRPVTRSCDVSLDLPLMKRLSKQSRRR